MDLLAAPKATESMIDTNESAEHLLMDVDAESKEVIQKLLDEEKAEQQRRLEADADLRCKICLESFESSSDEDLMNSVLPL